MSKKTFMIVGGLALAAGVAYWFAKSAKSDSEGVRGVTKTSTGNLVTSPIQQSDDKVAFLFSPLKAAVSFFADNFAKARTVLSTTLGNTITGDRMAAERNSLSAAASSLAPLRPDYAAKLTPSSTGGNATAPSIQNPTPEKPWYVRV